MVGPRVRRFRPGTSPLPHVSGFNWPRGRDRTSTQSPLSPGPRIPSASTARPRSQKSEVEKPTVGTGSLFLPVFPVRPLLLPGVPSHLLGRSAVPVVPVAPPVCLPFPKVRLQLVQSLLSFGQVTPFLFPLLHGGRDVEWSSRLERTGIYSYPGTTMYVLLPSPSHPPSVPRSKTFDSLVSSETILDAPTRVTDSVGEMGLGPLSYIVTKHLKL